MADELVDVVNGKDEIVGQEWKNKCHREGIWHRISAVLLFDSKGKIWLQKRSKNKTLQGRNLDFSASGHLSKGDTYESGADREMEEELGIKTKLKDSSIKIFEDFIYDENSRVKHVIKLFFGEHNGPFKIQEEELEDIQAYSLEEIKKLMEKNPPVLTEGLRLILKEYFKKN